MTADIISFAPRQCTGAGLTEQECYILARATPNLPGAWHVQYDEDNNGHGSMALVADHNELGDGTPVFLVWRDGGHLRLGLGQGDFYAGLGTHVNMEAVIDVVHQTLKGTEKVERWMSCELVHANPLHATPHA